MFRPTGKICPAFRADSVMLALAQRFAAPATRFGRELECRTNPGMTGMTVCPRLRISGKYAWE
jgi:hypothetical protein